MRKLGTMLILGALLLSTGCAKKVAKTWASSGGSRADATVEVAFVYNPNTEIPEYSEAQGRKVAEEKCRFWGYQEAEPFGMMKKKCQEMIYNAFAGPQCVEMLITQEYQCLGRGDRSTPLENTQANIQRKADSI